MLQQLADCCAARGQQSRLSAAQARAVRECTGRPQHTGREKSIQWRQSLLEDCRRGLLPTGPAANRACCRQGLLPTGPAADRACCQRGLLPTGLLRTGFNSKTNPCSIRCTGTALRDLFHHLNCAFYSIPHARALHCRKNNRDVLQVSPAHLKERTKGLFSLSD